MPDNNIYIEFDVRGATVKRIDSSRIASGTRNIVRARFRLLGDWQGIVPVAIFARGRTSIQVLTVDGECTVPNEMTAKEGSFTVSVYGGDLKTTMIATVNVVKSGYVEDAKTPEPGVNVLSTVKTVDGSVKYIREKDGAFEYSADGYSWKTVSGVVLPETPESVILPYMHTQDTASTVWTVPHNLDFRYVSVSVINESGNITVPDITHTNNNIVTLRFVKPTMGVAIIRR